MLRSTHIKRLLQGTVQRSYSRSSNPTGGNDGKTQTDPDIEENHPIRRTFRLLGNDMRKIKDFFVPQETKYDDIVQLKKTPTQFTLKGNKQQGNEFQTHCDVLIVGGGGIGSSIAYWLKQKAHDGLNVVVVEKDDTYSKSAARLSIGGLCQQFSLPENIQMSLFCADFIRDAKEHFGTDIPLQFTPHGHLVLADDAGAEALKRTSQLQNELGARNELLSAARLSSKFPWLNCKDVSLGCISLEREGWFDSWALLTNFRRAACGYGAHFVHGEVVDFLFKNQGDIIVTGDTNSSPSTYQSLDKVVVQLPDGTQRTIKFALCVIAAGVNSGEVARMAHIGQGVGMMRCPLPIDARKRYMYKINTEQNAPAITMPMIVDTTGVFCRRDDLGGHYICGQNSLTVIDNDSASYANPNLDLQADFEYFESNIRPALFKRIPAFKTTNVVNSLSGIYGYNVYDENGILGPHPYYHNLYIASGFSGQGMQQTPAVGRAISELIMDGQFRTLDLSRLSFDRLIVDKPLTELNALN